MAINLPASIIIATNISNQAFMATLQHSIVITCTFKHSFLLHFQHKRTSTDRLKASPFFVSVASPNTFSWKIFTVVDMYKGSVVLSTNDHVAIVAFVGDEGVVGDRVEHDSTK